MTIEMVLHYGHQCIPIELRSFNALQSQGIPEGGKSGQVLTKDSDKDYDATWKDPTGGGTTVTIGGEAQDTFPADTYVGALVKKLHGELVDNAPEALDTLYELAKALGDDPNFATTVMGLIGKKVEKTEQPSRLYGTSSSGTPYLFGISQLPIAEQVAFRGEGGQLRVGKAVMKDAAVQLAQMDEALDERIGDISAALDEIIKLQEQFLPKGNNLFNLAALSGEKGTKGLLTVTEDSIILAPNPDYFDVYEETTLLFKDICPKCEVGKTYTLSWVDSLGSGEGDRAGYIAFDGGFWQSGKSFVLTEDMLHNPLTVYASETDGVNSYACGGTFTNIMLNEGDTALPYEPYGG